MTLRSKILFNQDWLYSPEQVSSDVPDADFTPITLPHTNVELPYHNFDDAEYEFISTYRKHFELPEALNGRRLYIDFDGAATATTLTINGTTLPEHRGGYVPFSFDITDYVVEDGSNLLEIHLDSRERPDVPPWGGTADYLGFGGIYRDAYLRYVAPVHISNVHIRTHDVLTDSPRVEYVVYVKNQTDEEQQVMVVAGMRFWRDEMQGVMVGPNTTTKVTLWSDLSQLPRGQYTLWSPQNPKLYDFDFALYAEAGFGGLDEVQYDERSMQTGFRLAEFKDDGFYLNGELFPLRGLNRHQMWPYIGGAVPARLQRKDAEIIRYELGCNVVRTSHYPQSPHFLQHCDEIGLLVFEEIPGWQHIGDASWQDLVLRDVRAMIERDWNHPSIIIWGVRINESWDNSELYTRTNALARFLDPTRPTGGVRFFLGSEFLEDVYTYNDFSNGILEPQETPHLVTEFGGHMFPTKTVDHDARLIEHALRHAKVQAEAATMGGVSGAIGWCAFDYNTHKEFGAGDRICYHGVMDIFRLPKYAAYFYGSQVDPHERIVLFAATSWQLGDIDTGVPHDVWVFSNCDEVEVFVGDNPQGRFKPNHERFPNLPHPPLQAHHLDARIAYGHDDLRVLGYLDGEVVAEHRLAMDGILQPDSLQIALDDSELVADGSDMTRLVVRITDEFGNPLRYAFSPITFEIEGPATLVGENPLALVGGQAALLIRAGQAAGTVTITASAPRMNTVSVTLTTVAN
ncbi:MAG: hypothetical protein CL607_19790 [Anaerolineaceae bacterium]|nr:hypothetical protein [Anaerolineaceae bacterium]